MLGVSGKFKQLNSLKQIFSILYWNLWWEGRVYSSLHQAPDHTWEQFTEKSQNTYMYLFQGRTIDDH